MTNKLNLKVEILDEINNEDVKYMTYLTFLEKDIRFDAIIKDIFLTYVSTKYKISISSSKYIKSGSVVLNRTMYNNNDIIYVPSMEKLSDRITILFRTDKERYNFLKRFYFALRDWSNLYKPFIFDSYTKITFDEDKWIFLSDSINNTYDI